MLMDKDFKTRGQQRRESLAFKHKLDLIVGTISFILISFTMAYAIFGFITPN